MHFRKDGESVAQRKRDAFKDGANDVSAPVLRCETDQRCARMWIEVRCTLTHQVWRPKHSIAASRGICGFPAQKFVGVNISSSYVAVRSIGSQRIAEPTEGK